MKKILSLSILAAILLFVFHDVCAQAKPKPQMVDMGLSVKWANIDLGAANEQTYGDLYSCTTDVASLLGEGWRVPTKADFEELSANCYKSVQIENGKLRSIVFTSRKNGAHITFYCPQTVALNTLTGITQSNPMLANGYNGYSIMLLFGGAGKGFVQLLAMDTSLMQPMKQLRTYLKANGLENAKYSEWPDNIRRLLNLGDNGFVSDHLEYLGDIRYTDSDMESTFSLLIRPVYSAADDE